MASEKNGINSADHPIVDPAHPRLILEPRSAKRKKRQKSGARSRRHSRSRRK
jgi:hypothetical protein